MKYMVLECHLGYAIVLDEMGRFKKVANQNYEVGQMVDRVFEMKEAEERHWFTPKVMGVLTTMMAAIVILFVVFNQSSSPKEFLAFVTLKINPEVRIQLNQEKTVVGLEGVNPDGKDLIVGYTYTDKKLDPVMDELVDLAIEKGYLYDGGEVAITFDGDDQDWIVNASSEMKNHMAQVMGSKVSATIIVGDTNSNNYEIVIPVEPQPNQEGQTDYDDNQYGPESNYQPAPAPAPVDPDSDYDDVPEVDDSPYSELSDESDYEIDDDIDDGLDDSDYEIDD